MRIVSACLVLVLVMVHIANAQVSDPALAGKVAAHQFVLEDISTEVVGLEQKYTALKQTCEKQCDTSVIARDVAEVRTAENINIKRIEKVERAVAEIRRTEISDVGRINGRLAKIEPALAEIVREFPLLKETRQLLDKLHSDVEIAKKEIVALRSTLEGVLKDLKLIQIRLAKLETDMVDLRERVSALERDMVNKQDRLPFMIGTELRLTTGYAAYGARLDWEIPRGSGSLGFSTSLSYTSNDALAVALRFLGKHPIVDNLLSVNYGVLITLLSKKDNSLALHPLAGVAGLAFGSRHAVLIFSVGGGISNYGSYEFTPVLEVSVMARF